MNDDRITVTATGRGKVAQPPLITVEGTVRGGRLDASGKRIHFAGAHVVDVNLSNQRTDHFTMAGGLFERCDFRKLRFPTGGLGGALEQTVFRDCMFDGADLTARMILGDVRFERCSFRKAKIRGWRGNRAEFIDCVFEGRLVDVQFCGREYHTTFSTPAHPTNEFHGNDFTRVDFVQSSFEWGIDVLAQRFPDTDEYVILDRARERIDRVRAMVARWPEDRRREAALGWLQLKTEYGMDEQRSLFVQRHSYKFVPDEVDDEVLALMRTVLPASGG